MQKTQFWRNKKLDELSQWEWEQLCDGCGLCCLHKLEDTERDVIHYTNVGCKLLNNNTCQCSNYSNRKTHVPECITLSAELIPELRWLPATCAYRLVYNNKDLPEWHHLKTGSKKLVHMCGVSQKGNIVNETHVKNWECVDYIIYSFKMSELD